MQMVTLISSPADPALDQTLVESLRNAWGGAEVLWPAPNEVAEFSVPQAPDTFWSAWQDCQEMGVDLVMLPEQKRRKKMLIADMDSTLIEQECIDELAAEAGIGDRVADITRRAMNGELEFDAALRERVDLLRGQPESIIAKVLAERITYMPGGRILVSTMRAHGAYCMLVSGGFTAFTSQVAETLGFDSHRANTLLVRDGRLSGEVSQPILGRNAKVAALREHVEMLEISADDVIAVGDGANDLGMLHLAGIGVALHAKPSVQAQCNVRINHGDLTALLYLQGFRRDEFTPCGR